MQSRPRLLQVAVVVVADPDRGDLVARPEDPQDSVGPRVVVVGPKIQFVARGVLGRLVDRIVAVLGEAEPDLDFEAGRIVPLADSAADERTAVVVDPRDDLALAEEAKL